jgi:exopolysaccharide production protein ExoY
MVTYPGHVSEVSARREPSPLRASAGFRMFKRICDLTGSLVFIVLLCPLFLIAAILVFALDGAPIIYRRRVVGTEGEFDALKFRTMRRNADRLLASDSDLQRA